MKPLIKKLLNWLRIRLFFASQFIARQTLCRIKGHDYGAVVYISPAVMHLCARCGRDVCGRTFDDLEPMNEEDWEWFESQQRLHNDFLND